MRFNSQRLFLEVAHLAHSTASPALAGEDPVRSLIRSLMGLTSRPQYRSNHKIHHFLSRRAASYIKVPAVPGLAYSLHRDWFADTTNLSLQRLWQHVAGRTLQLHEGCDLLHVHAAEKLSLLGGLVAARNSIPYVITLGKDFNWENSESAMWHQALKRSVAASAAVIVPTEDLALQVEKTLCKDAFLIPPGTDLPSEDSVPTLMEREDNHILYIGPAGNCRHFSILADAVKTLHQLGHDVQLTAVVDRSSEDARANAVSRVPFIRFVPPLDSTALSSWMRRARFLCLPATSEFFGVTFLQGLKHGMTVIGRRRSNHRGLGEDGKHYALFREEEDLVRLLRELLGTPDRCLKMAGDGQCLASSFTWERAAREHMKVYDFCSKAECSQRIRRWVGWEEPPKPLSSGPRSATTASAAILATDPWIHGKSLTSLYRQQETSSTDIRNSFRARHYFTLDYEELERRMQTNEPFAYSRFNDGELYALFSAIFPSISGLPKNMDGHGYYKTMGLDLLRALAYDDPSYYTQSSGRYIVKIEGLFSGVRFLVEELSIRDKFVDQDVFHGILRRRPSAFRRFLEVIREEQERTVCVGPRYLRNGTLVKWGHFIEVPQKNCYLSLDQILNRIIFRLEKSNKPNFVLFSASMASNVLIHKLHERFGNRHFLIDVGSLWDVFYYNSNASIRQRKYITDNLEELRGNYNDLFSRG